jgi:shikimate kinase
VTSSPTGKEQIVLIGARGAGKSAAGMRAAQRLGLAFFDSDQQIVARAGKEIGAIFAEEGEATFRELERDIVLELFARPRSVISTGGGSVTVSAIYDALCAHSGVLWLAAPAPVLAKRISRGRQRRERPSLTGDDPVSEVPKVLAMREPLYRSCASQVIDASVALEEVVRGIEQFWQTLSHHDVR